VPTRGSLASGNLQELEIRVVHVTDGARWAGIESHLWNLTRVSADPPLRHLVCFRTEGEPVRKFRSAGVKVQVLSGSHRRAVSALRRVLRDEAPDVLHMHGYLGVLIGSTASLGLPPALVSTWHARIDRQARPSSRIWWYSRLALRIPRWRGAHFIAVTDDIARDYRSRGAPERRVHVVRNGILPGALDGIRVAEYSRGTPLRVTAIGSLIPVKDFNLLLRVARVLCKRGFEADFTIAGDGPLLPELEAEAAALNVAERVHFVGRIEDVSELLARTDVLVFTSRSEGVPYVLLEALAAGLPVVAPPVGGFLEVLRHEESGLIAADRSPEAIADCLARLVEDGALRRSLAAGAASAASGELSAQRMSSEMGRVYAAACVH